MLTVKIASKKGTNAVKKLREQKLRNGLPFMINVKELVNNQCYFEYPNGSIKLVTLTRSTSEVDVVCELSALEADALRKRLHFQTIK